MRFLDEVGITYLWNKLKEVFLSKEAAMSNADINGIVNGTNIISDSDNVTRPLNARRVVSYSNPEAEVHLLPIWGRPYSSVYENVPTIITNTAVEEGIAAIFATKDYSGKTMPIRWYTYNKSDATIHINTNSGQGGCIHVTKYGGKVWKWRHCNRLNIKGLTSSHTDSIIKDRQPKLIKIAETEKKLLSYLRNVYRLDDSYNFYYLDYDGFKEAVKDCGHIDTENKTGYFTFGGRVYKVTTKNASSIPLGIAYEEKYKARKSNIAPLYIKIDAKWDNSDFLRDIAFLI